MLAWLRGAYSFGRLCARLHIGPAAVTTAGLLLSLAVPPVVDQGRVWVLAGAALVLLSALADSVDGAVAVITGRASKLGFVYDSLADRLSELAWLAGLKVIGVPGWLVVVCGAVAWLHEYLRARAAAAGMSEIGLITAAERPTRVVFAVLGFGLAGAAGYIAPELSVGTATGVTAIWTLFALIGLLQLLTAVHVRLSHRPAPTYRVEDLHSLPKKSGRGAGGAIALAVPAGAPDEPADEQWAAPTERA